jgi:hypothetical protein
MKKTKLVLKRDQIKILTSDLLSGVEGGMWPDSRRCVTQISQKSEVACGQTTYCVGP